MENIASPFSGIQGSGNPGRAEDLRPGLFELKKRVKNRD
jgi:hypothetical protein